MQVAGKTIRPDQKDCFNEGVEVALEACDGPNVNVALAKPLTEEEKLAASKARMESALGLTAGRPAPTSPVAQVPTRTTAPAALAADAAANWPELTPHMNRIGGGEKDAAVIVGVENYAFVSKIPHATKNARDWYDYFTRARGTNVGNVKLLLDNDATDVAIRSALAEASKLTSPGGTLWFVFIGHGAPSQDQRDGVLVGVDAQQSAAGLYGRSVPQRELVKLAEAGRHARSVFVIDACFSGRSSSGSALVAGLQPLLTVKAAPPSSAGVTVLSAGRSDQFAGPLPKADRPAFSYLALGALLGWGDADRNGEVTTQELTTYSTDTLRAVVRGRNQTPEAIGRSGVLAKSAGARGPDVATIVSRP
jgi:hypothetical protein